MLGSDDLVYPRSWGFEVLEKNEKKEKNTLKKVTQQPLNVGAGTDYSDAFFMVSTIFA